MDRAVHHKCCSGGQAQPSRRAGAPSVQVAEDHRTRALHPDGVHRHLGHLAVVQGERPQLVEFDELRRAGARDAAVGEVQAAQLLKAPHEVLQETEHAATGVASALSVPIAVLRGGSEQQKDPTVLGSRCGWFSGFLCAPGRCGL